jgi:hypothetical protein
VAAGGGAIAGKLTLAQALFAPRAVALVGASGDASKNTARPQRFLRLHGYSQEAEGIFGRSFSQRPEA